MAEGNVVGSMNCCAAHELTNANARNSSVAENVRVFIAPRLKRSVREVAAIVAHNENYLQVRGDNSLDGLVVVRAAKIATIPISRKPRGTCQKSYLFLSTGTIGHGVVLRAK
jgi:hypothetical protein